MNVVRALNESVALIRLENIICISIHVCGIQYVRIIYLYSTHHCQYQCHAHAFAAYPDKGTPCRAIDAASNPSRRAAHVGPKSIGRYRRPVAVSLISHRSALVPVVHYHHLSDGIADRPSSWCPHCTSFDPIALYSPCRVAVPPVWEWAQTTTPSGWAAEQMSCGRWAERQRMNSSLDSCGSGDQDGRAIVVDEFDHHCVKEINRKKIKNTVLHAKYYKVRKHQHWNTHLNTKHRAKHLLYNNMWMWMMPGK